MSTDDRASVVNAAADGFFGATARGDWDEAMRHIAEDAVVWQNVDRVERRFADSLPRYRKMSQVLGPWAYEDVRRLVADSGFCEQHVVAFDPPGGTPSRVDVCAVVAVDDEGRIKRIDEYLDSAST
jgi:ketosteroid isomerase-like protein